MSQLPRMAALAASALFLIPTSASAASRWSAPSIAVEASAAAAPIGSVDPVAESDGAGNLTAIWLGDQSGTAGVHSASRPVGGAWTTPVRLAPGDDVTGLTLAVGAGGVAVAGWLEHPDELSSPIHTATRTAGGSWSAPTPMQPSPSSGSAGSTVEFSLAVDGSGAAQGSWIRDFLIDAEEVPSSEAKIASGNGDWQSTAAPGDAETSLQLGVDDAGNTTLAFTGGPDSRALTMYRPAGGSWGAATPLDGWTSNPADPEDVAGASNVSLEVNGTGQAIALWRRPVGSTELLEASVRTAASGSWSTPAAVFTSSSDPADVHLATEALAGIDDQGNATVLWTDFHVENPTGLDDDNEITSVIRSRRAASGGTWDAARSLAPELRTAIGDLVPGDSLPLYDSAMLDVSAGGAVVAAWRKTFQKTAQIDSSVRRDAGDWEPSLPMMQFPNLDPEVAPSVDLVVDRQGRGTLLWVDGRQLKDMTIGLAGPMPVDVSPTPTPTPKNTETPPSEPVASRLVLAINVVPAAKKPKKGKKVKVTCPTRAAATVDGTRTLLRVKKTRLRNRKIVCRVTGTVLLKTPPAAGASVRVLITAKGIKRKSILVKPVV